MASFSFTKLANSLAVFCLDSDATNDHGKKKFVPAKSKPTLTSTKDPAFTKAQDYVKAGGKVAAIKAKYALSQEIEQQLTTL